jgi:hypothetical protein
MEPTREEESGEKNHVGAEANEVGFTWERLTNATQNRVTKDPDLYVVPENNHRRICSVVS